MTIEHWIALVSAIPCVEWIMRQNQPNPVPNVLLLVVLDFHKLISEIVVVEELIVVVSQYQVLLPLQVLQQSNRGLRVVAGDVTEDIYMIAILNYSIPVLRHPVIVILRPIQLVVGEGQLVLSSSYWIGVGLIPKMDIRNVEIVCHHQEVNLLDDIYNNLLQKRLEIFNLASE